jgi:hypothetical protein
VDYDTNVFLLSDQQVLYKLRFDWNKDDKFIEKTEQNQIIDVYSRFGWLGFISKSMNSDSEYELKINKYSNDQRVDEYVNNISAYKLLDE